MLLIRKKDLIEYLDNIEIEYKKYLDNEKNLKKLKKSILKYLKEKEKNYERFRIKYKYCNGEEALNYIKQKDKELLNSLKKISKQTLKKLNLDNFPNDEIYFIIAIEKVFDCNKIRQVFLKRKLDSEIKKYIANILIREYIAN